MTLRVDGLALPAGGSNGQVLEKVSGAPAWATPTAAILPSTVMEYQGAWSSTTTFAPGDIVTFRNQLWQCGVANTGITPTTGSVYATAVLADSPTFYYRLGDTVGASSAADTSGNAHTGTLNGTITFGQGGALTGDSNTAALVASNSSSIYDLNSYNNPTTWTMECWFKSSAAAAQGLWIFEDNTALAFNSLDRYCHLDATGALVVRNCTASAATYNDGNWHHLAVVCTASAIVAYIDGVSVVTGTTIQTSFTGYWQLGTVYLSGGNYNRWQGTLDEFAYYNGAALTAARVLAHYNAGHSANPWISIATNPLTTQGDMIIADSNFAPARAAAGTASQVLVGGTTPAFGNAPAAALPLATTATRGAVQLATSTPAQASHAGTVGVSTAVAPQDHAHLVTSGLWLPGDLGYLAWTYDAALIPLIGGVPPKQAGTIQLTKMYIPVAISVTSIDYRVGSAGTVLSNCFIGLFASDGTLIGTSADMSASWVSAGFYDTALVSGPFSVAAGWVWVGVLCGAATVLPRFTGGPTGVESNLINGTLAASVARSCYNGSGLTALATLTPSANTVNNAPMWAALK